MLICLQSLLAYLEVKPTAYLDEIAYFLWDEYEVFITQSAISRYLKKLQWSRKGTQRVAAERNQDLRDNWILELGQWTAEQLVFVDESAANEHTMDRKYGWAPVGIRPTRVRPLKRSERWSILPAYTVDGYITWRIVHGSITSVEYTNFFRTQLLPRCNPYPGRNSVIIQDNASIHRSEELRRLCEEAGVKLAFLPPYSPDFNPIEETFSALKSWMKKHQDLGQEYVEDDQFETFLTLAVQQLAVDGSIGGHKGRFRRSKVTFQLDNHIYIEEEGLE